MKPLLLPALRRLLRDRTTVQLGVDPRYATTVEFANTRQLGVLELLDGTRTAERVARDASRFGLSRTDALRVIGTLRTAGVIIDAGALHPGELPEGARRLLESETGALSLRARPGDRSPAELLRRRRNAKILISGYGKLAVAVGTLLAASGVGRLELAIGGTVTPADLSAGGLRPDDLGRPRAIAGADAVRRAAPYTEIRSLRGSTPDLAILVGTPHPDPTTALRYARRRCPHLPVWLRDGVVVLGPLVRPGLTACLDCMNLHRRDRDPSWPVLAAQLATAPGRDEPAEAALVAFGAGLVAMQALCHIDGGAPDTLGGTLELSTPGRVRRRNWTPHPQCGCVRSSARPEPGARHRSSGTGWTMAE